ncbi:MAG: glycoside hydrolase family 57 protein [Candidatus Woesearchaeota archaeon]
MVAINFYFQVHQPFRLRQYSVFDIGHNRNYFDETKNRDVMLKVAQKCYLPMNALLLRQINKYKDSDRKFKVTFSISGVALEQFSLYAPEVLESYKKLAQTGCVEFLSETYYHSLSFLYSRKEFEDQIKKHDALIEKYFGVKPRVFRNTELIYGNEVAHEVEKLGFDAVIGESIDHILDWKSPNFVYQPYGCSSIKLLLKNYKLSDDIAFRFSNRDWESWPLTTETYCEWLNSMHGNAELVNLFMDYETFGEHQWEDTGIFNFMERLPEEFFKHSDNTFVTCSEAISRFPVRETLDYPYLTSWADTERDLSAWLGNKIQNSSIEELYKLEKRVKDSKDLDLLDDWQKLTTSDHFYYMCTKWFNDGDVHKYFNPYDSPYDAFIAFMNVIQDIKLRLDALEKPVVSSNVKADATVLE